MIFRRRRKADPYVLRGEELLAESGWQRVSGDGSESVWTDASGGAWATFEEAIDEMALLVAPECYEEQRWLT